MGRTRDSSVWDKLHRPIRVFVLTHRGRAECSELEQGARPELGEPCGRVPTGVHGLSHPGSVGHSEPALGADGRLVVYTACGPSRPGRLYWCKKGSAVWNNSGDTAFLQDPRGNLVSKVDWVP